MSLPKIPFLLILILVSAYSPATANPIKIGSSYESVIEKLGKPDGELSLGNKQILTYGDAKITLRDETVESVSPGLNGLLQERADNQKMIEAKREAGLINFRGKWITPKQQAKILKRENDQRLKELASQSKSSVGSGAGAWLTDFSAASKIARKENKKMLLNFTGSDWCGWCIKLDKEVFSTVDFMKYARKNYILVELDFPKRKQLAQSIQRQNNALAKKYGIRGFPTVLVLNSNGTVYKKGGYVRGGPDAFLRSIR